MSEEENFLSRWSRRKLAAKADAAAEAPRAEAPPAAMPGAPPAKAEESAAAATAEDGATPEYREFFDPQVDEKLRRTALKQLFSDPHFNVMDGLDTYIDDYSQPDPIPEAMLRQLNQAKNLFLFDQEKKAGAEGQAQTAPDPAASSLPAATEPAAPPQAAPIQSKDDVGG